MLKKLIQIHIFIDSTHNSTHYYRKLNLISMNFKALNLILLLNFFVIYVSNILAQLWTTEGIII
jgi:hypothetical protein